MRGRNLLLTAALAGIAAGAAFTPTPAHAEEVKCFGVNSCKGTGACGGKNADGTSHSCAGQNSCKGQGFSKIEKDQCVAKGGSLTAPAPKSN